MSNVVELKAAARDRVGKGAARAMRRTGQVPGVIYGDKKPATPISVGQAELVRLLGAGSFFTTLFNVEVGGEKSRVIPRDVQFDPVRETPVHVDLLRLGEGARIDLAIPVTFVNEEQSPGIRRGGVLNVVRHEVELTCPVDSIPDHLVADLTGMDIGDSLHISAITLPEGAVPTITDRDFTVATVAAPARVKTEEEEAAEAEAAAVAAEGEEAAEGADAGEEESEE